MKYPKIKPITRRSVTEMLRLPNGTFVPKLPKRSKKNPWRTKDGK